MPTRNLRSALDTLASEFANAVLTAVRTASLDELASGGGGQEGHGRRGPGGPQRSASSPSSGRSKRTRTASDRLARRSPEQIAEAVGRVVALVKKRKDGLRSEQIRAELGMDAKEMPRVLKEALTKKALTSKGQKRGTLYFAKAKR